jgi:hypothetical protein
VVMPNYFHAIVIIRGAAVGAGLSAQNGYLPALDDGMTTNGATTRVAPTGTAPTLFARFGIKLVYACEI